VDDRRWKQLEADARRDLRRAKAALSERLEPFGLRMKGFEVRGWSRVDLPGLARAVGSSGSRKQPVGWDRSPRRRTVPRPAMVGFVPRPTLPTTYLPSSPSVGQQADGGGGKEREGARLGHGVQDNARGTIAGHPRVATVHGQFGENIEETVDVVEATTNIGNRGLTG
jgi:hypothetical protein